MGHDQDKQGDIGQFDWVNVWAASAQPQAADAVEAVAPVSAAAASLPDDQLMRDIAEIERRRDTLAAMPLARPSFRKTHALTLVPARTTDPVPVVIGGVLALVMLTVFGAAAAMSKLSR